MTFQRHVPGMDSQQVKRKSCLVAWAQLLQAANVEKRVEKCPWVQRVLLKGSASDCGWLR